MNFKKQSTIYSLLAVLFLLTINASAQDKVIIENDFEDGEGYWIARGNGVSAKDTKKEFAGGKRSLQVKNRSANWHGAQIDVTPILKAGKSYNITISAKLAEKESPDELKLTMQRGLNQYVGIDLEVVNSDGWKTLQGKYKEEGGADPLILYVEATRTDTNFFLDNFKITEASDIPDQKGVLLKNDFEDSTAQNWVIRGDRNVQMFSSTQGGTSRALRVEGRSETWHGLALDISPKFFKGRTYRMKISVKLASGQAEDKLKLTMQQTPPEGDPTYAEISPAKSVTSGEWVTLEGDYTVTTDNNNLLIYVEAENPSTSFFIDDFELSIP